MAATFTSHQVKMTVVSIMCLALMGYVDFATGYDLIFSAAYLIPVCLCAWYLGPVQVWLMSLACSIVSFLADLGHPYSESAYLYWNAFLTFVVSVAAGLLLVSYRKAQAEREEIGQSLRNALDELTKSAEQVAKLQAGLLTVCAWTNRIEIDGKWVTPEEFLTDQLQMKLTHGISPEAARKFTEDAVRTAASRREGAS